MLKSLFIFIMLCVAFFNELAQVPMGAANSTYTYHPPSSDKESWQWLNLMLSATFFRANHEGEIDFDSCLLYASHSLGLSRISILAEGIEDESLRKQSKWIDEADPATGIRLLTKQEGKEHLELLLLLGAYYAFQPQRSYPAENAKYFLSNALKESIALKERKMERQAVCLLGKMYFELNDVKHGDSIFNHLIKECELDGDHATEARALFYWGFYPPYTAETMLRRIANFQSAAALYHDLKNTEGEINALTDEGYLMVLIPQLPNAHEAFLKALRLAEEIRYPYTHYNTNALVLVTLFEGKFGEPLKYSIQSIRTAEITRDSIPWPSLYTGLGILYHMEGGREEESLKALSKANEHYLSRGEAGSINLYDLAAILVELGRSGEALDVVSNTSKKIPSTQPRDQIFYDLAFAVSYKGQKRYNLAEQHAMEADSIQKRSPTLRGANQRALINSVLGYLYFDMGEFAKSKKLLNEFLANPSGAEYFGSLVNTYSKLIAIDSVFGDNVSEVNHYKIYKKVLDSSYRVSKIRQAEELQVMYQTQEKENQIALLNQRSKLEQANLKQATLTKNVTIAGIIAIFIIAGLLYRQNRLRKKNNGLMVHKNEQLQHLLTEKEWLLKEIHHRVKNNLQIVMSLLNSQSAYIDNEPALTAIHDSQHRVHAMSLIHQKLYGSENVSSIDMPVYIRELVSYLAESIDTRQRIHFAYDIMPLELDVSQAVPLALILNEAITNSIKYAFPGGRSGVVSISLSTSTPDHYSLIISDNGIGMPPHFIPRKSSSLGMSLMHGLSEDLNGSFLIETNDGTTIKISFVLDKGIGHREKLTSSYVSNN